MKIDLDELLAAPSSTPSPAFRGPRITSPRRITRPCWKGSTGGLYQGHGHLPERTKRRLSQLNRPINTFDRSGRLGQDDYSSQSDESCFEFATPSPRGDDHDPFQGSPHPQSSSSTQEWPRPRLVPPTPLSTRSAPGRLEPNLTTDLTPSADDIDDAIIEELRNPLSEKKRNGDKVAEIYLWEVTPAGDPDRKIVKIGNTGKTQAQRIKQVKSKCKPLSIERTVDAYGMPIFLFEKAENLIHAQLKDRRCDFKCRCPKTKHREYFDVDAATGHDVIRCWRAFCELDPYDANGKLRPFWEHRLRQRKKLRLWNDRATSGHSELESRRRRWEVFANPRPSEILWFRATVAGSKAWPWRLQIIVVIEAIALGFSVSPPSYLFWIWVLILSICLLWDERGTCFDFIVLMRTLI